MQTDAELLILKQECIDCFEDENGEENVIGYAECVPDLVDEILRLRKMLENEDIRYDQ